jgi:hypothetical protein
VLRAAGETETTQENIQDLLELDEGDPGFQLLIEEEIDAVMFFYYYFHHHSQYYSIFHVLVFQVFLRLSFISLIKKISPPSDSAITKVCCKMK